MRQAKASNFTLFLPILFVALNFCLKISGIDANEIGGDEPFSIYHAQFDIRQIIADLSQGNNPPLYEILLHCWIRPFGISAFSVRLLSVIFSSLTVFYLFKTGVRFFNLRVAVLASLFYTFSSYFIVYAHEARVYSLFALLTAISMYLFLRLTENPSGKKILVSLILVNVLLVYAHYLGILVIFIQGILVIGINSYRKSLFKSYFWHILAVILLYLPNLLVLFHRFFSSVSGGTWIKPIHSLGEWFNVIFWFSNQNKFVYLAVLGILYLFFAKLWSGIKIAGPLKITGYCVLTFLFFMGVSIFFKLPFFWKLTSSPVFIFLFLAVNGCLLLLFAVRLFRIHAPAVLLLAWFFIPLLCMFTVSLSFFAYPVPVFIDRYLLFFSVGFCLLLGFSLDFILRDYPYRNIIFLLTVAAFIISFKPVVPNRSEFKKIIAHLPSGIKPHRAVFVSPAYSDLNFMYYFDRKAFRTYHKTNAANCTFHKLRNKGLFFINTFADIPEKLPDDIIYLDACTDFVNPKNGINSFLNQTFKPTKKLTFKRNYQLYFYSRR